MNPRERIVEQFEMSQMAKKGVSKYKKIELPEKVIIRTENIRGKVESAKLLKTREEVIMPPKPEEGVGKNVRELVKRQEKVTFDKMRNSNRRITELHTSVPIIYYVMMGFGLASAIFGAFTVASYPIYYSVMIGGIGVFLVAFIGFLEIKYTKRKLKITVE